MMPTEAVARYVGQQLDVSQYCVAYSGGMDSHVLLALMAQLQLGDSAIRLRAVHIDHGLQADSARWAEHASKVCEALEVPLEVRRVEVLERDEGPEASARIARYKGFSSVLRDGEHLLLAQHAEDQAETFLLQALRGSGPDGLSGIPRKRAFANGYVGRPLLNCSRESLQAWAEQQGLEWIEDPSNQESQFDRNYLRLTVMPLLKARWPAYAQTLGRAAQRSAAASQTLSGVAEQDLDSVRIKGTMELSVSALKQLPRERVFNLLRLLVRQRGLRMPRLQDLVQVMSDLIEARSDSNGLVNIRDYVFRRHGDHLYLLPPQDQVAAFQYAWEAPFAPLLIKETGLVLSVALCLENGIRLPERGTVIVRSRTGGELLKMGSPAFRKAVKKILQEAAVPPWLRDSIPLLYVDGQLAAILGIAVGIDFQLVDCELPDKPSLKDCRRGTDTSISA